MNRLPHLRSEEAKKRRKMHYLRKQALRYVVEHAFRCPVWAETICITDKVEVVDYLCTLYPNETTLVLALSPPALEKGFVLADSRGRGVLQK